MLSYNGNTVGSANYTIKDYYRDSARFTPAFVSSKNPNLVYYKIECGCDKHLGKMSLCFEKDGEDIYLNYIEIFNHYRNIGLGTKILKNLVEFCKKFGSKKIYLLVDFDNEKAQKLYSGLGFVLTGNISPKFCYEMELLL